MLLGESVYNKRTPVRLYVEFGRLCDDCAREVFAL